MDHFRTKNSVISSPFLYFLSNFDKTLHSYVKLYVLSDSGLKLYVSLAITHYLENKRYRYQHLKKKVYHKIIQHFHFNTACIHIYSINLNK